MAGAYARPSIETEVSREKLVELLNEDHANTRQLSLMWFTRKA
jgi:hypothetical protein